MPRASKKTNRAAEPTPIVSFDHGDRTYQIDTARRKVYRRFVEVETSRAAEIVSLWRAAHAAPADA